MWAFFIFFILAILLTLQSIWSLRGGFQFLSFARRSRKRAAGNYHPPAAVIIPCKGLDRDLQQNSAKFMAQDYPCYQAIFVVASDSDPAYAYLSARRAQNFPVDGRSTGKASLVVAGHSKKNGEKVNNLLAGLGAVRADAEVLVFADIDATPETHWLRELVGPLKDPAVTVSTGFRWYIPSASLTSRLRAAWDTSVATLMGEHNHNFAWGGSMAVRKRDFQRLKVAERYWQGTVSDDYAITRAVRHAGGTIRFEPRCLMVSHNDSGFREFLRWTNRQIIITRVYAAHYWKLGLASYGLYAITFLWGLALILLPGVPATQRITAAGFLLGILALGIAKGALRAVAAREMFPAESSNLERYGACYWQFAPLVPWVMLFNFVTAGFTRRIEWQGTLYELKSMHEMKVICRK